MSKQDKPTNQSRSRRKFLALGVLGGASLLTGKADAQESLNFSGELVPMLTPDGKLVEVPKEVYEQMQSGKKANNGEILSWSGKGPKTS